MPVFFATDLLIYLLLLMCIVMAWRIRHKEHLRRPWRKVATNTTGMVSLVVLSAFVIIGLLDTVHFRADSASSDASGVSHLQNEPVSLFDWWVGPLRTREEKTYSSPFASHLYSSEMILREDGSRYWGYARLRHAGVDSVVPGAYDFAHIFTVAAGGLLKGLLCSLVFSAAVVGMLSVGSRGGFAATAASVARGRSEVPWRAMLGTALVMTCLGWVAVELSAHYHILGTDKVGQDVLYQSLKSIRTGLVIGTVTTLVMLPFALTLGILAGYYRGWVDDVIQYLYTTLNSIPGVLLIAASILVVQVYMANHEEDFASLAIRADVRLLFLCLILGITSWTGLCRLLRGETLKLREMEYVQAARALGVRDVTILARHIFPNVFHIVLISIVLDFSGLVLAEAVLSYVNIGVDPTTNSWGNMINSARLEMAREPVVWWSLAAAFAFMFTLVLAANLFADAVRDAFDPRRGSAE